MTTISQDVAAQITLDYHRGVEVDGLCSVDAMQAAIEQSPLGALATRVEALQGQIAESDLTRSKAVEQLTAGATQ